MTTAWNELLATFSENFILVPPIRPEFRRGLSCPEPDLWSTRPDTDRLAMYRFEEPILEVIHGSVDPYFAVAYTGHGTNSNTYTLNLVTRRAAIFLQFGVGPEYTHFVQCRVNITRGFVLLDRLIANIPEGEGDIDYVVAYSDLRGSELLRRSSTGRETRTRFAGTVSGWDSIDFATLAAPTGVFETLDGGLFTWREPMEFELAACKYLTDLGQGLIE